MPERVALPEVPGWTVVDYRPLAWWEPRAQEAAHRLIGSYADDHGRRVDVFIALYPNQNEGNEAGGFGQGALMPNSSWSWIGNGPATQGAKSERLLSQGSPVGRVERLALTWYRNGESVTGSNMRLKLANMADRLLLRGDATTLLIVSAEEREGQRAQEAIDAFLTATGPVGAWMDRVANLP